MLATEIRRTRPSRPLTLVALLAAASTTVLGVAHPRFGGGFWSQGDDVALVGAWAVAFAASAWLFGTTAACALAVRVGRPDLARWVAPALPLAVRRLVEIAILSTCVALPALPASAATTSTPTPVVADQPVVRTPAPSPVPVAPVPVAATPAPTPPARPALAGRVVVQPGDNLWLIARASLARVSARPPTESEVMRYWLVVIAANRSTLRSGNPGLIFPGEIVTVPAATAVS